MNACRSLYWWLPRSLNVLRTQALLARLPVLATSPWISVSTSSHGLRCWHLRRPGKSRAVGMAVGRVEGECPGSEPFFVLY